MTVVEQVRYEPVGDRALLVEFGDEIRLDVNRKVHSLDQSIRRFKLHGVEECVPTYRSLLVYYDPLKTDCEQLVSTLKTLETSLGEFNVSATSRKIEVPVVYGGKYGPDLNFVADYHDLKEEDVVKLHSKRKYFVYMLGFVAGFPYMGEVPKRIATPRLDVPRLRVPAGSVGIAEAQTGIYPCDTPGGWRVIGRTPLKLFDVKKHPPALIQPGDTVTFRPASEKELRNTGE